MTYPKEGIEHISAPPPGVAMLVRIAACVAWFFAWPICAGFDGDTLSHLGIAVAIAQEIAQETVQEHVTPAPAPNVATEGELVETEAAPQQDAHKFTMRTEGAEPSPNQPVSPEPALASETPFGLATRTRFRRRNSAQMEGRSIRNSRKQQSLGALPRRRVVVSIGGTTFPCHR